MLRKLKDRLVSGCLRVGQPLLRLAIRQQLLGGDVRKQWLGSRRDGIRQLMRDVSRDRNFHHGFAQLNQLSCAGARMRFELSPLCPRIRLVVVVDVAQQERIGGLVHDQAKIGIHADRPEVLVARLVQPVEGQSRAQPRSSADRTWWS